jgi:hypothetical protein
VTISVSDGFTNQSQSFLLTVIPPVPPTLAALPALVTSLNTPTNVALNVISPDTALSKLTFTGKGTNGGLVQGVSFAINGTNVTATVNVISNRVGFDVVTIGVSDGLTNVTQSFALTVTPVSVVKLSPIGTQNTSANNPPKVALTVSSPDTSVTNLFFTGTSTNKALVSGITFTYNGSKMVAIVGLVPNKGGQDFVTINVTDGFSSSSQSFVLNVSGGSGVAAPATLKVTSSGNQLIIDVTGTVNGTYDLQSSPDLKVWTSLGTVTAPATITNTISASVKLEFLRAQSK